MRLRIENIKESPVNILRRAGYVFVRNEKDEMSFIRAMARSGYPRFHMYAHLEGLALVINFHLDQKKETYGENTRHHGEYEEDGALKIEAERIQKLFN